jgi:hypothetical protein
VRELEMRRKTRCNAKTCKTVLCLFYGLFFFVFLCSTAKAVSSTDEFIAGYVSAILEREFQGTGTLVSVKDGVIVIRPEHGEDDTQCAELVAALSNVQGVVRVHFLEPGNVNERSNSVLDVSKSHDKKSPEVGGSSRSAVMFPKGRLFQPLIADPRWPHFSASYQCYIDDDELDNVGATSFGESFSLIRREAPFGGEWEFGIQAAVFAVFDLDAESLDLINADYWVGFPLSYRKGKFSSIFRIFHQSSHLGDEYLLRNRIDRVNVSYESLDFKVSYELTKPVRIYGGAGFLFHRDPSDLDAWSVQCGLELKCPYTLWSGRIRPIAGFNLQSWEETRWDPDLCLRMGIQFEGSEESTRRIQLLLEYFNGHSPNGQFYGRTIEYAGFGTHLYF